MKKTTITVKQPLGLFANELLSLGIEYYAAFKALNALDQSKIRRPSYFMLSHSVEITLKSFLVAKGLNKIEIKQLGHELSVIYSKSITCGLPSVVDLDKLIDNLNPIHKDMHLRYPKNRKLCVPYPHDCYLVMDKLVGSIKPFVFAEYLRSKSWLTDHLRQEGADDALWSD